MGKWKAWVLLGVVALHILAAAALHGFRPDPLAPRALQRTSDQPDELLMLLEFPAPRKTVRDEAKATVPKPLPQGYTAPPSSATASASIGTPSAVSGPPAASLDLHLPPPVETKLARPGLLDNRPAISYQGTRYERAWISEGNLTHVVARKSQLAGVLLSVMGALIEPCTEADRSHYKRGCVQDQYVHEPEELMD